MSILSKLTSETQREINVMSGAAKAELTDLLANVQTVESGVFGVLKLHPFVMAVVFGVGALVGAVVTHL